MKRIIPTFIVFVFTLSIFCSCQKAPSKEVVISKNDGSFKEKLDQTSPVQETTPVYVSFDEQFLSTDGSVHFTIDIDGEIPSKVGQVVEVAPHLLTEDDARRAAKALLGDVLLYERRSSSNPQYSKSQYQQKIQRFANYATRDALTELMGADGADTYLEYVKRYIEIWTEKSTTAPDEDTRKLCDWTLKKERYYNDSDVEIGDRSIEDDCDLLNLYSARSIGEQAFTNCTGLTEVSLGSAETCVAEIGKRAFNGCTSLKTVAFTNVKKIVDYAFEKAALESADLSSVESIGANAFAFTKNLKTVVFGSSLTTIGSAAFSMSGLTTVDIPGGVSSIGGSAFSGCNSMVSMTLNEGISVIPNGMVQSGTALETVSLPQSLTISRASTTCMSLTWGRNPAGCTRWTSGSPTTAAPPTS